MPDNRNTPADRITGRGLITAEAIYANMRKRLLDVLDKRARFATFPQLESMARDIMREQEPLFARHLADTQLAAWLAGYKQQSDDLPPWTVEDLAPPPGSPPPSGALWPWEEEEPIVRFPLLEAAAERLSERGVLSREDFDAASATIKQQSFTVAGDHTESTLNAIRDVLVSDIKEGTSLKGFRATIEDVLNGSPIGPAHLENVYRTNVQGAFRDGRETLLADPIVSEVFPYQEYVPIHDARTREEHLALGSLGLNGTGIYRRDDPMWDQFTPPWDYQCRCGTIPMTIRDAAERGVKEAQEWLETGFPPIHPEWRAQYIPFESKPGWGQRGGRTGATSRMALEPIA
jgi:hypothetical protein